MPRRTTDRAAPSPRCTAGGSTSSRSSPRRRPATRPRPAGSPSWRRRYPGDPSVAATLLLNLVELAPGEAIFLGAGNLHAYLGGCRHRADGRQRQRRARWPDPEAGGRRRPPRRVRPDAAGRPGAGPGRRAALDGTAIRLLRRDGPAGATATAHELVVTTAGVTGYLAPARPSRSPRASPPTSPRPDHPSASCGEAPAETLRCAETLGWSGRRWTASVVGGVSRRSCGSRRSSRWRGWRRRPGTRAARCGRGPPRARRPSCRRGRWRRRRRGR